MAKLRTVARQLASLDPTERRLAIGMASDLVAAGGVKPRRRKARKARKPQKRAAAPAPKPRAVRESKPRLPVKPAVKPLSTDDEDDE